VVKTKKKGERWGRNFHKGKYCQDLLEAEDIMPKQKGDYEEQTKAWGGRHILGKKRGGKRKSISKQKKGGYKKNQ